MASKNSIWHVGNVVSAIAEEDLVCNLDAETIGKACHATVEHYRQLEEKCGISEFGNLLHSGDLNGGIVDFIDLGQLVH